VREGIGFLISEWGELEGGLGGKFGRELLSFLTGRVEFAVLMDFCCGKGQGEGPWGFEAMLFRQDRIFGLNSLFFGFSEQKIGDLLFKVMVSMDG
jgi:hypothetical protein